jgi:hypothetical protein
VHVSVGAIHVTVQGGSDGEKIGSAAGKAIRREILALMQESLGTHETIRQKDERET